MKTQSLVTIQGDHLGTNTLIVAKYFSRNHKDLLRNLRSLMNECGDEFGQRNFAPTSYKDTQGKKCVMYNLTRDGFMLLSMAINGSRATKLKIAFIEEFNRMERELAEQNRIANQVLKRELLEARPLWEKISRYQRMGLTTTEIAKLTGSGRTTVRGHKRKMEVIGLLSPRLEQLKNEVMK
jgi:Rha family phage regulatory protein